MHRITVPTLVIGAQHDTMNPKYTRAMAKKLPQGQFLLCPKGGHMAMYDDSRLLRWVDRFFAGCGNAVTEGVGLETLQD